MECLLAPKTKQSYLFLAPLQWPWQGYCWNKPRECNAVRHSCVPPPPYRHRHCPPPDHSPLFASIRWPGQAGLTSAGSVAAGSDGCLLGRIHFPCGYVVYVLLCCWGVFPVLTLYSPRSIVWGLFFSPPLPHVNAVFFFNSTCISLLIILVWLCMWRIIKNLEPWGIGIKKLSDSIQALDDQYSHRPTPELHKQRLNLQAEFNLLTTGEAERLLLRAR